MKYIDEENKLSYQVKLTKNDLEYLDKAPTLILILYREYFDAILKGEKYFEYRNKNKYWQSRLKRFFDLKAFWIEFRNGYAKDSPRFKALCMGIFLDGDAYSLEIIRPNSIEFENKSVANSKVLFSKVKRLEHRLKKAFYIEPKLEPKPNIIFEFIAKFFRNIFK